MPKATNAEVFKYQADQQRSLVLRNAQGVLRDLHEFVERLQKSPALAPSCNLNVAEFMRLMTDYTKLETLADALEIAQGEK